MAIRPAPHGRCDSAADPSGSAASGFNAIQTASRCGIAWSPACLSPLDASLCHPGDPTRPYEATPDPTIHPDPLRLVRSIRSRRCRRRPVDDLSTIVRVGPAQVPTRQTMGTRSGAMQCPGTGGSPTSELCCVQSVQVSGHCVRAGLGPPYTRVATRSTAMVMPTTVPLVE